MADVAQRAGVSVATVSRALSGSRPINPELAAQVFAAADELGYRVNLVGRALRQTRTQTVGLIVPDLGNPFFAALAQHLTQVFTDSDIDMLIFSADDSLAAEMRGVHSFLGRQVDALVMIPVHEEQSAAAVSLAADSVTTVQLDRRVPGTRAHTVAVDNRRGMRLIADHVRSRIDREAHPVVYVGAEPTSSSAHERLDGFRQEFGSDAPALLGSFSVESGHQAARRLLDSGMRSATIVTAADVVALGVLAQLLHSGHSVPHDFRVIGFDGIGVTALAQPSLTTVRQPVEAMTRAIRDLLVPDDPDSAHSDLDHRFEPEFILGATSP